MRAALFKRNHIECRRMRVINVVDLYLCPAPFIGCSPFSRRHWFVACRFWILGALSPHKTLSASLQVAFVLGLFNTFLWISLLTLVNNTLLRFRVGGLCLLSKCWLLKCLQCWWKINLLEKRQGEEKDSSKKADRFIQAYYLWNYVMFL